MKNNPIILSLAFAVWAALDVHFQLYGVATSMALCAIINMLDRTKQ